MIGQTSILIVDRCLESREVLRTALAHRGLRILEAARGDDGLALARSQRPELIVLDLETVDNAMQVAGDFAATIESVGGRLIVLGSALYSQHDLPCEFFAKPYHYKPLVLRIEELLHAERGRAAA